MVNATGLVKLWHKPQCQVFHTMFFFNDKFPMIAHVPAQNVCILPQWVDRVLSVHQFAATTKKGKVILG